MPVPTNGRPDRRRSIPAAAARRPLGILRQLLKPDDDPEWVRQVAKRLGLSGLKCYHLQAPRHPSWEEGRPTWDADICDYLPESLVRVADDEGWVITLHPVKRRAAADPANIHWIRRYCETFPNMKLILAHSARGFQPAHNLEGLSRLEGLENLYFDCSVNCFLVVRAVIVAWVVAVELFAVLEAVPVSGLRDCAAALWLFPLRPFLPSCLPD